MQYLCVPVHSSNENADTVSYAIVSLSPELQAAIKHRAQTVSLLRGTDQDVNMVQYWDNHVTYYTYDEVYEREEYEDNDGPWDILGRPLELVLREKGYAWLADIIPIDPAELWRKIDCCVMEVNPQSVRWCALEGDTRVSTWDVSLSDILREGA